MIQSLLFKLVGALLVTFGLITIIYPQLFTQLYGMGLETSDSIAAIRSIIGGCETALGLIFIFGHRLGFTDKSLSILGVTIFSSLVLARGYHLIIDSQISNRFIRELLAESVIAMAFIYNAARLSRD